MEGRAHRGAGPKGAGQVFLQGAVEKGRERAKVRQRPQHLRQGLRQSPSDVLEPGQQPQGIPDVSQVPGRSRAQAQAGKGALHVPAGGEKVLQIVQRNGVRHQAAHVVLAFGDGLQVHQGAGEPVPQRTASHGRAASVQAGEKGVVGAACFRHQIEVFLGRLVQVHVVVGPERGHPQHVAHRAELGGREIVQHRPGRPQGGVGFGDPVALQGRGQKGLQAADGQGVPEKLPRLRQQSKRADRGGESLGLDVGGIEHLPRRKGGHQRRRLLHRKGARLQASRFGGQERHGQGAFRPSVLYGQDGRQASRVFALLRNVGPRGDDPHHPALHDGLPVGLPHLVAQRHAAPGFDQAAQIHGKGVVGNPRHRDVFFGVPAGQGDLQDRGDLPGVVEETFVKVPHPKEQQGVGVLLFPFFILGKPGSYLEPFGYAHTIFSYILSSGG